MDTQLSPRQQEAVLAKERKLLIVAGAGSGKTHVLTLRIAWFIKDGIVPPENLLAITFTNKAARELEDRLMPLVGLDALRRMEVGTFHAVCGRILRRYIKRLGYGSNYTIYDRADQKTLLREILKTIGMDAKKVSLSGILSVIGKLKNQGISPEEYREKIHFTEFEKQVAEIYPLYEARKENNNALDFDDMLLFTVKLAEEDEEVRERLRARFRCIFVDEYQDTNHVQYRFLRAIVDDESYLTVVGDADQSIYAFRGADISNILDFNRDYPDARVVKLEENYRSTGNILRAANMVIRNNTERVDKILRPVLDDGDPVRFFHVETDDDEADRVVGEIVSRARTVPLEEIAILYRTNAQSRVFEDRLMHRGIEYRVVGGLKFYDRKEVKDFIAYLKLIANPDDNVAFQRVVNTPKRGIGDKSVAGLVEFARTRGTSLFRAIESIEESGLSGGVAKKFRAFYEMIERLRAYEEDHRLVQLVMEVYEVSGYRAMLLESNSIEDKTRMENIDAYLSSVASFEEENEGASLEDYLASVMLLSDQDKSEEGGVNLLTVHSAKGLEFDTVFVAGLEEGIFPSQMSMNEGGLEEERRLMYVAATRAKRRLYLSAALMRRRYGSYESHLPSRFIEEMEDTVEKEQEVREESIQRNTYGRKDQEKLLESVAFRGEITKSEKPLERKDIGNVEPGDKVDHAKFGEGTVVEIKGDILTISFENGGIKRMRKDIPQLKLLA